MSILKLVESINPEEKNDYLFFLNESMKPIHRNTLNEEIHLNKLNTLLDAKIDNIKWDV